MLQDAAWYRHRTCLHCMCTKHVLYRYYCILSMDTFAHIKYLRLIYLIYYMSCWTFVQIDLKALCSTARPVLEGQPSRRWQPSSWWSIFFVTLGRSSSHGDEWMGAIDVVGCAKFVSMGIDLESYGVIWGHMIYIMQLYMYTVHVWHTDIYII